MNITGKNIRQLRHQNGWSQGDVAKKLNISIPAFSKIETGFSDINISRLTEIARIFNVSPAVIITQEGQNPVLVDVEQISDLKNKLSGRDQNILELQKRIIDLYEIVADKRGK